MCLHLTDLNPNAQRKLLTAPARYPALACLPSVWALARGKSLHLGDGERVSRVNAHVGSLMSRGRSKHISDDHQHPPHSLTHTHTSINDHAWHTGTSRLYQRGGLQTARK